MSTERRGCAPCFPSHFILHKQLAQSPVSGVVYVYFWWWREEIVAWVIEPVSHDLYLGYGNIRLASPSQFTFSVLFFVPPPSPRWNQTSYSISSRFKIRVTSVGSFLWVLFGFVVWFCLLWLKVSECRPAWSWPWGLLAVSWVWGFQGILLQVWSLLSGSSCLSTTSSSLLPMFWGLRSPFLQILFAPPPYQFVPLKLPWKRTGKYLEDSPMFIF